MKRRNGIDIYETLQEIIDPRHSCLVVWDVQHGLFDRIFNKAEFIAALKPLIETARNKMPVFYTLIKFFSCLEQLLESCHMPGSIFKL